MNRTTLVNGETVTTSQLSQWRREFGGAFVDAQGCLLVGADHDGDRWYLLNQHSGQVETGPWPCATYCDMPDGLGGYIGGGATVREFIAAARRLKAQREARDIERAQWPEGALA